MMDFKLRETLPDGPLRIEVAPHCYTFRRMTERDIEYICSHPGELESANAMADRKLDDVGLSEEDWEQCPEVYHEYCYKGCYKVSPRRKGHVVEFGVRGVYICLGCDYAWPPIDDVTQAEDDFSEPD